jgi:P4 family phage/plasmid primase-like protien
MEVKQDNTDMSVDKKYDSLAEFMISCKKVANKYNIHDFIGHKHYQIDHNKREQFAELYYKHVFVEKKRAYLLERPLGNEYETSNKDANLFKVDIDLRANPSREEILKDKPIRKYNIDDMKLLVLEFINELTKYVELPKNYRINILEKDSPTIWKHKGVHTFKDGVHIVGEKFLFPNSILHKVRDAVIAKDNIIKMFEKMKNTEPIDQIVDKRIINTNDWFLYGSGKDDMTYNITHTFKVKNVKDVPTLKLVDSHSDKDLWVNMSNMFSTEHIELKHGIDIDDISKNYKATKYKNTNLLVGNDTLVPPHNGDINLRAYLIELINLLGKKRATEYDSWWRVGQSLYNISADNIGIFHEFSKKSTTKYNAADCEDRWKQYKHNYFNNKYQNCKLNVIIKMAEEDNKDNFDKIQLNQKSKLLKTIIVEMSCQRHKKNFSAVTFAKLTKQYLDSFSGLQLKCIVGNSNNDTNISWYYYKYSAHRWIEDKGGMVINTILENDYLDSFLSIRNTYQTNYNNLDNKRMDRNNKLDHEEMRNLEDEGLRYLKDVETTERVISYVETNAKRADVKKNLVTKYNDPEFYTKINTNKNIFVCKNGVLDLDKCEFRPGVPEDMMMAHTDIEYVSPEEIQNDKMHCENNMELHQYLNEYITDDDLREYELQYFARSLDGNKKPNKLAIFSGGGSNGKTTFIDDLIAPTFGQYFQKSDPGIITRKRPDPNSPSEAYACLNGKRLVVCEEPDQNGSLDLSIIKDLTGGGTITARHNFKPVITFPVQFQLALLCNDRPSFNTTDNGSIRRLLPIPATTTYVSVESNDYHKLGDKVKYPNYYPSDDNIQEKLHKLAPYMLSLLFEKYKKCKKDGFCKDIPPILKDELNVYLEESNIFAAFRKQHLTGCSGKKCNVGDAFTTFIAWGKLNNQKQVSKITKHQFSNDISRLISTRPVKGYWANQELMSDIFTDSEIDDDDDDDDNTSDNKGDSKLIIKKDAVDNKPINKSSIKSKSVKKKEKVKSLKNKINKHKLGLKTVYKFLDEDTNMDDIKSNKEEIDSDINNMTVYKPSDIDENVYSNDEGDDEVDSECD